MEEPKKVLKAMYVGAIEVNQPTGMEVLNEAIDKIVSTNPIENWDNVNVSVAPSMISVNSSVGFWLTNLLFAKCYNFTFTNF